MKHNKVQGSEMSQRDKGPAVVRLDSEGGEGNDEVD